MPPYYITSVFSGEASIKQSFVASLFMIVFWTILSLFTIEIIGPLLAINAFVVMVNLLFFGWGALAIYCASITSHAISHSYATRMVKFFARFCNFILLLLGIIMIILVTSGEVSWMTYLTQGVNADLK